ncbi:MAG TPA: hypothetical protein VMV49_11555 [Candidatus Deferrimicrobium sp.]|nr:hypothetical protein [Candidatus Deferrimicrobium sp.]
MSEESYDEKIKISREIRELLIKANQAIKENKLEAAKYYASAAELSKRIGHTEIAQDYMKKAKELQGESGIVIETPSVEDDLNKFVQLADKAIMAGNFSEAARIYEEASRIIPNEAKRLISEAMALRKKEADLVVNRKELQRKTENLDAYEETLTQIKAALEKDQYEELVSLYGRAAVLAEKMGKRPEAAEYRKAAIEINKKRIEQMRAQPKDGRRKLVERYTEVLKQLKVFLDEKKWKDAANAYSEAAELAFEMEEIERGKLFRQKAAELQAQANEIEIKEHLKQKRLHLRNEIDTLDPEKDTARVILNYQEILEIYKELDDSEGFDEINKKFRRIKKVQRRKEFLIEANEAMEKKDNAKAVENFQNALRLSIDLDEPNKAEAFRKIIEELQGKVDKVARNRMMIEQRAKIIANAKAAVKEDPPNIEKSIEDYREAARISYELGESEIAQSYLQTSKKMEEDKNLIIERENFVKEAEAAVKEKNFLMASNYYNQAAKFSEKLGESVEANKYQKKANALKDLAEDL